MKDFHESLPPAVTFDNVTVSMGGHVILENICATVPKGKCTTIVGPNGAGKSSLLSTLLGELPHTGHIDIPPRDDGKPLRMGYVPQRIQFDRGMPMTVLEFMVMGRQRSPLFFGVRKAQRDRARELLSAVKVENMEQRRIGALSGGEIQRVLLALAISRNPDLLVLDEPAAGVDFQGEHLFCELLDRLRIKQGFTQLMVSHDLSKVTHHADHVICLNRKVAAQGPPREVLTAETLTAIFGLHMGLVNSRALPGGISSCSSPCCVGDSKHA